MEKYHIYEEIGKGKFSQVFKGREKKTIEYVAIKRVDKGQMSMVVSEVQIMHKLDNPHALRFYDWYETKNNLWLILEYCAGGDLSSLLSQDGHLPEASVRLFGLDMLLGLKYVHSLGLVHGDVRPTNFLMDEHGILKLSDFKGARKLPKSYIDVPTSPVVSRGKLGYLAPELIGTLNGPTSAGSSESYLLHSYASDIFSLGCTLYEMRRGKLPFGVCELGSHYCGTEFVFNKAEDENNYQLLRNHLSQLYASNPLIDQNVIDPVSPVQSAGKSRGRSPATPLVMPGRNYGPDSGKKGTPGSPSSAQKRSNSVVLPSVSPELSDLISWMIAPNILDRCNWAQLGNHPFWYCANQTGKGVEGNKSKNNLDIQPLNIQIVEFPVHALFEQLEKRYHEERINALFEEKLRFIDRSTGSSGYIAPAVSRPETMNFSIAKERSSPQKSSPQKELNDSINKDLSRFGTPKTPKLEVINVEGSATPALPGNTSNVQPAALFDYYRQLLPHMSPEILISHSSDTQVKPLVANRAIEIFDKATYKAALLPKEIQENLWSNSSQASSASTAELEQMMTWIYKTMHKLSSAGEKTGSSSSIIGVDKERMNILSYLLSLASSAEVANFVLNSSPFLSILLRYISGLLVNPPSLSKTSSASSRSNTTAPYATAVSSTTMFCLQVRSLATTILAVMLRYATNIRPPVEKPSKDPKQPQKSQPHILSVLLHVLKDTNLLVSQPKQQNLNATASGVPDPNKVYLRKRCMAAFGEMLFYISAQDEEEADVDKSNGWTLPAGSVSLIASSLYDPRGDEPILQHYAARTVENILAQGSLPYRLKFVSLEIAERLLWIATYKNPGENVQLSENIQATAGMALSHLLNLVLTHSGQLLSNFSSDNLSLESERKGSRKTSSETSSSVTVESAKLSVLWVRKLFCYDSTDHSMVNSIVEQMLKVLNVYGGNSATLRLQHSYLNILSMLFCNDMIGNAAKSEESQVVVENYSSFIAGLRVQLFESLNQDKEVNSVDAGTLPNIVQILVKIVDHAQPKLLSNGSSILDALYVLKAKSILFLQLLLDFKDVRSDISFMNARLRILSIVASKKFPSTLCDLLEKSSMIALNTNRPNNVGDSSATLPSPMTLLTPRVGDSAVARGSASASAGAYLTQTILSLIRFLRAKFTAQLFLVVNNLDVVGSKKEFSVRGFAYQIHELNLLIAIVSGHTATLSALRRLILMDNKMIEDCVSSAFIPSFNRAMVEKRDIWVSQELVECKNILQLCISGIIELITTTGLQMVNLVLGIDGSIDAVNSVISVVEIFQYFQGLISHFFPSLTDAGFIDCDADEVEADSVSFDLRIAVISCFKRLLPQILRTCFVLCPPENSTGSTSPDPLLVVCKRCLQKGLAFITQILLPVLCLTGRGGIHQREGRFIPLVLDSAPIPQYVIRFLVDCCCCLEDSIGTDDISITPSVSGNVSLVITKALLNSGGLRTVFRLLQPQSDSFASCSSFDLASVSQIDPYVAVFLRVIVQSSDSSSLIQMLSATGGNIDVAYDLGNKALLPFMFDLHQQLYLLTVQDVGKLTQTQNVGSDVLVSTRSYFKTLHAAADCCFAVQQGLKLQAEKNIEKFNSDFASFMLNVANLCARVSILLYKLLENDVLENGRSEFAELCLAQIYRLWRSVHVALMVLPPNVSIGLWINEVILSDKPASGRTLKIFSVDSLFGFSNRQVSGAARLLDGVRFLLNYPLWIEKNSKSSQTNNQSSIADVLRIIAESINVSREKGKEFEQLLVSLPESSKYLK